MGFVASSSLDFVRNDTFHISSRLNVLNMEIDISHILVQFIAQMSFQRNANTTNDFVYHHIVSNNVAHRGH